MRGYNTNRRPAVVFLHQDRLRVEGTSAWQLSGLAPEAEERRASCETKVNSDSAS